MTTLAKYSSEIDIQPPPATLKSPVWIHYGFLARTDKDTHIRSVDKGSTVCTHCKTILKYTGSTTNMATHLKRHPPDMPLALQVKKEPAAEDTPTAATAHKPAALGHRQLKLHDVLTAKLSNTSQRALQITRTIGVFIATDLRPFSIVNQPGFKNMIGILEPRYVVPSRRHFSEKIIPDLYAEARKNVELAIANADNIAITTDGWTSRATVSYNTITALIIDSSWTLKSPVLQTLPMYESHTGAHIGAVLKEAMTVWGINTSQVPVVSYNAANMVITVKESGLGPHIRCFAHTLNLATQRGLKTEKISRLLGKIRRVISFFHRSSVATSTLIKTQKRFGIPIHKLVMDVPTRWNSSYELLERFVEQQAAILGALMDPEVRRSEKDLASFTDEEITHAEEALEVLDPIKKITTVISDEKNPSISMLFPLKRRVLKFTRPRQGDSSLAKELKSAIHKDMEGRYVNVECKIFLLESSFLDPRFRSLSFLSDREKLDVYDAVEKAVCSQASTENVQVKVEPAASQRVPERSVQVKVEQGSAPASATPTLPTLSGLPTDTVPPQKKQKTSVLEDIFADDEDDVVATRFEAPKSIAERVQEELSAYKMLQDIPIIDSPLIWWKDNERRLPLLAKRAKFLLAIAPSSVPSERIFSTAGDIVNAQRATLSPQHMNQLNFLKKNLE